MEMKNKYYNSNDSNNLIENKNNIDFFIDKFLLGDCLKVMKYIPDNSIDCIFTDFPYNINEKSKLTYKKGKPTNINQAWGKEFKDNYSEFEYLKLMRNLAKEFNRIIKDGSSILLYYDHNKPYFLFSFYIYFEVKNSIILEKNNPPPHTRFTNYRNAFEQCMWFSKGKPKSFNFISQIRMRNIFSGSIGQKQTEHPTEKYDWMIRPLILRHTNPDDIILDPFCGSGTIPILSKILGRRFIAIDNKKEYIEMSINRLQSLNVRYQFQEQTQTKMF